MSASDVVPDGQQSPALRRPEPGRDPDKPQDADRALVQFFRTGTLPQDVPMGVGLDGHAPALLFDVMTRKGLRTPYPVLLDERGDVPNVVSLGDFVDSIADAIAGDGDEGALRRLFLARIEGSMRASDAASEFEETWWAAVDAVRPGIRSDRRDAFEETVRQAADLVPPNMPMLPCDESTVLVLAQALAGRQTADRARTVLEEADRLGRVLGDMLDVEREESRDAVVPDRLKDAVGGAYADAFDFDALSHLLDEAPHKAGLAVDRRERVERLVSNLSDHVQALYGKDSAALRPVSHRAAREAVGDRLDRLVSLYRDLEAARLEARHRFQPDVHDDLLDALTPSMLSTDDLRSCPPILVTADQTTLDAAGIGHLSELLAGHAPVKILLVLRNAPDDPDAPGAAALLPALAIGHGRACVVQTVLSDAGTVADGIGAALRHDGPALVAIHAGSADTDLPRYFAAAVARDGRAVPTFTYTPDVGRPWADRLSVVGNETPETDWPGGTLVVQAVDQTDEAIDTRFTWLDYAAAVPSLAHHFLPVDPAWEGSCLVPASTYLALPPDERGESVPFVWCATPDGTVYRTAVDRPLTDAAERALDRWRRLRELGGVANSYAERAVAEARTELEAERDASIEAAEKAHAEELERAIGSVAESIVSNIAASLLDLPAGSPAPARSPAAASPAAPSAEAVDEEPEPQPEPEEDEEPEESIALDEAYIETIRCTSCNECTNLNGQLFAYNDEKQAYIKDASAGPYRDLVQAAEKCPVRIIHPGKPLNPDEPGLDDLLERAKPFL